jgi:hypothetical protein
MLMGVLFGLLAVGLIVGVSIVSIGWSIHISMVKGHTTHYGWAGYRKFVEEFRKVDWVYDRSWANSLFSNPYGKDHYHADIIKFNHNGMIIHNPISLILVKIHVYRYIKKEYMENREVIKAKKKSRVIKEWY